MTDETREPLTKALRAWLDSHGEADIEERLADAANEWLEAGYQPGDSAKVTKVYEDAGVILEVTREAGHEQGPLRDHDTCVPHEHVETDMARWKRDQAASLVAASLGGRPQDWARYDAEKALRARVLPALLKAWELGLVHGGQPTDEEESTLPRAAEVIADELLADAGERAILPPSEYARIVGLPRDDR